ncbi:hypothetical protein B0H66DRAFT_449378, partial [Apodospora peruviana]
SSQGSSSNGASLPRKRARQDPSGKDGEQPSRNKKRSDSGSGSTAAQRFLACPYWKREPQRSRDCCKLKLKRIRDVKQHLHRRHTPGFYCEVCYAIFPDDDSHQDHILLSQCRRQPNTQLDGISHAQQRALSRKSNPSLTEEEQWFDIWKILFPAFQHPFSAYIDAELSADLCLFREHWQRTGHEVLLDTLRRHG